MNSEIGFFIARVITKVRHEKDEKTKLVFFRNKGVKFPGGEGCLHILKYCQKRAPLNFDWE